MNQDEKTAREDGHGFAHTPGPWFGRQMTSGAWDVAAEDGNGETLARVKDGANSRLVAAAPELLEALLGLMVLSAECLGEIGSDTMRFELSSAIDEARGAIRKARGE